MDHIIAPYRGRRLSDGEWVYGYLFQSSDFPHPMIIKDMEGLHAPWPDVSVSLDTVGRLVGIFDGRRVYTRDIITFFGHFRYEVVYNPAVGAFCLRETKSGDVGTAPIGNILNAISGHWELMPRDQSDNHISHKNQDHEQKPVE